MITGEAAIDATAPAADHLPAYLDKYHGPIARLGSDPERFAREYSVPIRIRPTKLRAW